MKGHGERAAIVLSLLEKYSSFWEAVQKKKWAAREMLQIRGGGWMRVVRRKSGAMAMA